MAAVKTAGYTVTSKFKLGESKYGYIGKYTLGKEYLTGGFTVTEESESRFKLPEKIDFSLLSNAGGSANGVTWELTSGGKLKGYFPVTKAVGEEITSAADLTSTIKEVTFYIIGS